MWMRSILSCVCLRPDRKLENKKTHIICVYILQRITSLSGGCVRSRRGRQAIHELTEASRTPRMREKSAMGLCERHLELCHDALEDIYIYIYISTSWQCSKSTEWVWAALRSWSQFVKLKPSAKKPTSFSDINTLIQQANQFHIFDASKTRVPNMCLFMFSPERTYLLLSYNDDRNSLMLVGLAGVVANSRNLPFASLYLWRQSWYLVLRSWLRDEIFH